jgi:hypothetical protein
LVDNACACTSYGCRRQGRREYETGRIGPDHVDKVVRASDIATNCAICFAKST